MLGMRFTFHNEHNRPFLTDGSADWLWPAAERAGIPLMVLMPSALDILDKIAAAHPGLRLVIGLGLLKASGMPSLSTEGYPFRDLHSRIRTLLDAFGPKRTFWGTDLTRMPCTYYECIALFTEHLPWLKGEDLEWVMGRGVCEWLGWPMSKERPS